MKHKSGIGGNNYTPRPVLWTDSKACLTDLTLRMKSSTKTPSKTVNTREELCVRKYAK